MLAIWSVFMSWWYAFKLKKKLRERFFFLETRKRKNFLHIYKVCVCDEASILLNILFARMIFSKMHFPFGFFPLGFFPLIANLMNSVFFLLIKITRLNWTRISINSINVILIQWLIGFPKKKSISFFNLKIDFQAKN